MKALLVVVALSTSAHAHPVQLGRGIATGWRHDVHLGVHATERLLVRARERVVEREVEVAFAFIADEIELADHSLLPVNVFAFAGTGMTNDRDAIGHAGVLVRVAPVVGARWMTFEIGARWGSHVEGFAAMSLLLSKRSIRSMRAIVSR